MVRSPLNNVLHHLRRLLGTESSADLTDAQLVERFVTHKDEAAFAALVERHGPLVLGVCKQVLHDEHSAEDVFQATFLVLARKAGSIRGGQALGSWLYRVAVNLARTARTAALRRQAHERQVPDMARSDPLSEVALREWQPMLHEELSRLPEKYRLAVLLCYLEGRTHEQAAAALGWPVGTVRSRLSRARDLLRRRLQRRGVTAAAAVLGVLLGQQATAAVPAALGALAVRVALPFAAGQALPAGVVSESVLALAEGALRTMMTNKIKWVVVVLLVLGVTGTGAGALIARYLPERDQAPAGVSEGPVAERAEAPRASDEDGKHKRTQLSLRSGYSTTTWRLDIKQLPGTHHVRLSAALDDKGGGKGRLLLDENIYPIYELGEIKGPETHTVPWRANVTFKLHAQKDGRKLYEIKGHGLDNRLFLMVPPKGATMYRFLTADKAGKALDVVLLEAPVAEKAVGPGVRAEGGKHKRAQLSLRSGYSTKGPLVDIKKAPRTRHVHLSATLDDKGGGKGRLLLDSNDYDIDQFGEVSHATERDVWEANVTFELTAQKDGRRRYEIKGHGLNNRLFLVVPPKGPTAYRFIHADKEGRPQEVVLLEASGPSGK
jgi:RNA polymerase sigma factor (sigma-70 family)